MKSETLVNDGRYTPGPMTLSTGITGIAALGFSPNNLSFHPGPVGLRWDEAAGLLQPGNQKKAVTFVLLNQVLVSVSFNL